ncbi:hypothetical protein D3C80_1560750 [compost metagenome]
MPDAGVGKVDQAPRHTASGHERAGQEKKWNCQQGVVFRGFEQFDGQRAHRILAEQHDGQRAGEAQGNGNGHTNEHQREQGDEQEEDGHFFSSSCSASFSASAASSAKPRPV